MEILNRDNYRSEIIDAEYRNKVIYCWSPECVKCKEVSGIVTELEKKYNTVSFYKMNTKENLRIATELKVKGLPSALLYKGSEMVRMIKSHEFKMLESQISKNLI